MEIRIKTLTNGGKLAESFMQGERAEELTGDLIEWLIRAVVYKMSEPELLVALSTKCRTVEEMIYISVISREMGEIVETLLWEQMGDELLAAQNNDELLGLEREEFVRDVIIKLRPLAVSL